MRWNFVTGALMAGVCLLGPAVASAENRVAVMKFDSLGSDTDELATLMFDTLRGEVIKSTVDLDANGSDITYSEMVMVTGCEREDSIVCYDTACDTLGAPAILFGSVNDDGETKIVWYVSGKGIFREVTGTISDAASAQALAEAIVVGKKGELVVTTNVPEADVFIDGKRVGITSDSADTVVPISLVAGNYIISVRKEGYNKEDAVKITIEGDKTETYHVDLTVATDPEVYRKYVKISGFSAFGAGVAVIAAGAAIGAWNNGENDTFNNKIKSGDPDFDYKGKNKSGKSMALTANVLYGVGGFLAAAGAAMVVFGYVYDFSGDNDYEASNSIVPDLNLQFSPDYQGVTAGWTF